MPLILSKHDEIAPKIRELMPQECDLVGGGLAITTFHYTHTGGNDTTDDGTSSD